MPDNTTPATKGDIIHLEGRIDVIESRMDRLEQKMDESVEENRRNLALAVETIRHDILSAHRDQIEMLKDKDRDLELRVRRLEHSAGFAAA